MNLNLTSKRQGRLAPHLRWLSPSFVALAVIALSGVVAPAAKADTYDFSLTDVDNPITITFSIAAPVTPTMDLSGYYFNINPVSYSVDGNTPLAGQVDFYSSAIGGGMDIYDSFSNLFLYQAGAQLYSGDEGSPTFTLGTYNLTDGGGADLTDNFTLTITDPVSPSTPTPEPSSLILLGAGLLGLAAMVVYQQKRQSPSGVTVG